MFNFKRLFTTNTDFINSKLFDEITFFEAFIKDLEKCKQEVIIESPYITTSRMDKLKPIFRELLKKRVSICFITRDPLEHDEIIRYQATNEILECSEMGIKIILLRGNHHRKLAFLDKRILWEGSLNILSFKHSREIMRRIQGECSVKEMFNFLKLKNLYNV